MTSTILSPRCAAPDFPWRSGSKGHSARCRSGSIWLPTACCRRPSPTRSNMPVTPLPLLSSSATDATQLELEVSDDGASNGTGHIGGHGPRGDAGTGQRLWGGTRSRSAAGGRFPRPRAAAAQCCDGMISVLIADDQALVCAGFRMILEAGGQLEVIGEAENGREAVSLTRELLPDVVLMDIRMPLVDGIAATAQMSRPASRAECSY